MGEEQWWMVSNFILKKTKIFKRLVPNDRGMTLASYISYNIHMII